MIAFPVTFKDLMAPVFNLALKAGHVGFVTDTFIQCISSSLLSLTKDAPSECQQHWPEYGGRDLQYYTV